MTFMFKDFENYIEKADQHLYKLKKAFERSPDKKLEEEITELQKDLKEITKKFNRMKRKTAVPLSEIRTMTPFRKKTGSYVYQVVKEKGKVVYGLEDTPENREPIFVVQVDDLGTLQHIKSDIDVVLEDFDAYYYFHEEDYI